MVQFHVLDLIYWNTLLEQIRLWADIETATYSLVPVGSKQNQITKSEMEYCDK